MSNAYRETITNNPNEYYSTVFEVGPKTIDGNTYTEVVLDKIEHFSKLNTVTFNNNRLQWLRRVFSTDTYMTKPPETEIHLCTLWLRPGRYTSLEDVVAEINHQILDMRSSLFRLTTVSRYIEGTKFTGSLDDTMMISDGTTYGDVQEIKKQQSTSIYQPLLLVQSMANGTLYSSESIFKNIQYVWPEQLSKSDADPTLMDEDTLIDNYMTMSSSDASAIQPYYRFVSDHRQSLLKTFYYQETTTINDKKYTTMTESMSHFEPWFTNYTRMQSFIKTIETIQGYETNPLTKYQDIKGMLSIIGNDDDALNDGDVIDLDKSLKTLLQNLYKKIDDQAIYIYEDTEKIVVKASDDRSQQIPSYDAYKAKYGEFIKSVSSSLMQLGIRELNVDDVYGHGYKVVKAKVDGSYSVGDLIWDTESYPTADLTSVNLINRKLNTIIINVMLNNVYYGSDEDIELSKNLTQFIGALVQFREIISDIGNEDGTFAMNQWLKFDEDGFGSKYSQSNGEKTTDEETDITDDVITTSWRVTTGMKCPYQLVNNEWVQRKDCNKHDDDNKWYEITPLLNPDGTPKENELIMFNTILAYIQGETYAKLKASLTQLKRFFDDGIYDSCLYPTYRSGDTIITFDYKTSTKIFSSLKSVTLRDMSGDITVIQTTDLPTIREDQENISGSIYRFRVQKPVETPCRVNYKDVESYRLSNAQIWTLDPESLDSLKWSGILTTGTLTDTNGDPLDMSSWTSTAIAIEESDVNIPANSELLEDPYFKSITELEEAFTVESEHIVSQLGSILPVVVDDEIKTDRIEKIVWAEEPIGAFIPNCVTSDYENTTDRYTNEKYERLTSTQINHYRRFSQFRPWLWDSLGVYNVLADPKELNSFIRTSCYDERLFYGSISLRTTSVTSLTRSIPINTVFPMGIVSYVMTYLQDTELVPISDTSLFAPSTINVTVVYDGDVDTRINTKSIESSPVLASFEVDDTFAFSSDARIVIPANERVRVVLVPIGSPNAFRNGLFRLTFTYVR